MNQREKTSLEKVTDRVAGVELAMKEVRKGQELILTNHLPHLSGEIKDLRKELDPDNNYGIAHKIIGRQDGHSQALKGLGKTLDRQISANRWALGIMITVGALLVGLIFEVVTHLP